MQTLYTLLKDDMNYHFLQFYLSKKSNLKNVMNLLNSEQDKVKD